MSGNSGGVLGPGPDGLLYICIRGGALEECPRGTSSDFIPLRLGDNSSESTDTESQVVPLRDRLVSAGATGRLELIPLKGRADLSLHSCFAAFHLAVMDVI